MTLNCLLTTCPFRVSHDVLVMSLPFLSTPPSCPCHFLGMSASFSIPVFRCQSFPYISRRVDWCPCPLFPFHSPCTPLGFTSVPFMSLSVPRCFPFMSPCCRVTSTSYFLPHFLAFPCIPPLLPSIFPQKKTWFVQRFRNNEVNTTQSFSRFSEKGGRKPKPAKSQQGIPAWDPCFLERHQLPRGTWGTPTEPYVSNAGRPRSEGWAKALTVGGRLS